MAKISESEKQGPAFLVYLELLDLADWLRDLMARDLAWRGLTVMQFQVLALLQREGPKHLQVLADRFQCSKQNMSWVIDEMEKKNWLRRDPQRKHPKTAALPMERKLGRRTVPIYVTPEGERLIARLFPRHGKIVRGLMAALDDSEQQTIARLSRKLREANPRKIRPGDPRWKPNLVKTL